MIKIVLSIMAALLFAIPLFTTEVHAESSTTIEAGSWSGIHQCFNGQMPIQIYIHSASLGGRVDVSYSHMKYTYSSPTERQFSANLQREKDRRYKHVYKIKYDTVVVFQGLTRKYLWEPTGISGSTKCHGAVLVQDKPTAFPKYKTHNDLCEAVENWLGDPSRVREKIERAISRSQIRGFNTDLAVWGHYFSDQNFEKYFGRSLMSLDNSELYEVIGTIHDCARYSTSNRYIIGDVSWFFGRNSVGRWASLFPFGNPYRGLNGMTWSLSKNAVSSQYERLVLIQNSAETRKKIDRSIAEIFLEAESPELRGKIENFRRKLAKDLVFQEVSYVQEVLNLLSARDEMLRVSEALASRFQLSEYPKLPPPDSSSEQRLLDDALLKPLTDEEIRKLEKSIEQDF